jgi:hypothetical protein
VGRNRRVSSQRIQEPRILCYGSFLGSDEELAPLDCRLKHSLSHPAKGQTVPKNNYPGKYFFVATDAGA